MYFLLNSSHYVKSYGHLCQILAFFYNARSPNIAMSRGPRSKFRKNFIFPNFAFDIKKSYKILVEKLSTSEVISQKTSLGAENTPPPPQVLLGLNKGVAALFICLYMLEVSSVTAAQTILQLITSLLMPQYWSYKISQNRAKKHCEGEY